MPGTSTPPHWEVTFDSEGDPDEAQRDALLKGVEDEAITDLVVFSHGWNNSPSTATILYDRFFSPFPSLLDGRGSTAKVGYAGVIWPSMRWTDEPIPDFAAEPDGAPPPDPDGAASFGGAGAGVGRTLPQGLGQETQAALDKAFPGHTDTIEKLAGLLEERPAESARLDEFFELAKSLTEDGTEGVDNEGEAGRQPEMLMDDPDHVFGGFLPLLTRVGVQFPAADDDAASFDGLRGLWNGAREMLRQTTYYQMKQRSGLVGRQGLGPVLARFQEDPRFSGLRVHLVGHSFGGRLVSFALKDLPDQGSCVHSVTLLQAAFSHFAFADRLPFDPANSGALRGARDKVSGPIVACFSVHDHAVGTFYPIASRLKGDDASGLDLVSRWGALGHDGIQGIDGVSTTPIGAVAAMADGFAFPPKGYANVDAASVVFRGGPPSGAHSDICHPELASVVLAAGRI
ncbi:serine-threonine protein kinase [Streptomyces sp. NPDC059443]|uniref:serine-threonine protein kinase n=1 Tax=unclassified Streptomyces TaxID=2593676 RepID=UPI0036CB0E0E